MKQSKITKKIIDYLELYQKKLLHGEFLINIIDEIYDEILNNENSNIELKKAISNFLTERETYEPHPSIRETNPYYLTGDDKLMEKVIKLKNIITEEKQVISTDKPNPKIKWIEYDYKSLISYINLYKEKKISKNQLLYIIYIFFSKYNIEFKNIPNKSISSIKKIGGICLEKSYIKFSDKEKTLIIKTMLEIAKHY